MEGLRDMRRGALLAGGAARGAIGEKIIRGGDDNTELARDAA